VHGGRCRSPGLLVQSLIAGQTMAFGQPAYDVNCLSYDNLQAVLF